MVKILAGYIAGGRADTIARVKVINVPLDRKGFKKALDNTDSSYFPNQESDYNEILKALKNHKIWTGWDSFGEGVVGFFRATKTKNNVNKLKNALRAEYMSDGDY